MEPNRHRTAIHKYSFGLQLEFGGGDSKFVEL